jgi:hypothetical protein
MQFVQTAHFLDRCFALPRSRNCCTATDSGAAIHLMAAYPQVCAECQSAALDGAFAQDRPDKFGSLPIFRLQDEWKPPAIPCWVSVAGIPVLRGHLRADYSSRHLRATPTKAETTIAPAAASRPGTGGAFPFPLGMSVD